MGGSNARIVDIVCVVLHETRHLLALLVATMLGFGFSFYVLFKQVTACQNRLLCIELHVLTAQWCVVLPACMCCGLRA